MIRLGTLMATALCLWAPAAARAQLPPDVYRVDTVTTPPGIAPEVSALTFHVDGKLYAAFRRGGIHALDPATGRWQKFAEGLQSPLGLLPGRRGELFVGQGPELTRVVDTDGDGVADRYETISDAWGMSGNYHEFLAGPVRDADGNFYLSLGCASSGASPRPPTRGPLSPRGWKASEEHPGKVNEVGHHSPVPLRGCVVKVTPAGVTTAVACGLRQPNGLVQSPSGDIFVTDNQGDWIGTSPLHRVRPGAFLGHPASLPWLPALGIRDPLEADVATLARLRQMPVVMFPHNDVASSLGQPVFDQSRGAFGPYAGQILLPDWTSPRIVRADLEQVAGEYQGAVFVLIDGQGLRRASHRLAFSPDGKSLYVGQTSRMWGSIEGLQRITWTGRMPMDILTMHLQATGFDLTFTKPVDPATARDSAAYSLTRYYYQYHGQYGSPKTDVTPVEVKSVAVSSDGRKVHIELGSLMAGRIYELRPSVIKSADGEPLATRIAAYTVNRLAPAP